MSFVKLVFGAVLITLSYFLRVLMQRIGDPVRLIQEYLTTIGLI